MPPANSPVLSSTSVEAPLLTLSLPSPPRQTHQPRPRASHTGQEAPHSFSLRSARLPPTDTLADSDADEGTSDADSTRPTHLRSPSPIPHFDRTLPSASLSTILRSINTPVMDLASTLTAQAEQNVEDENLEFLRRVDDELQVNNMLRPENDISQRLHDIRDRRRHEEVLQQRTAGGRSDPQYLLQRLSHERRVLENLRAQNEQATQNIQAGEATTTTSSSSSTTQRPIEQRLFSTRSGAAPNEFDGERARAFREMASDLEARGWSSNEAEETVLEGWLQFQAERAREERTEELRQAYTRDRVQRGLGHPSSQAQAQTQGNRRVYGWAPGSEQLDPDDHQNLGEFDFDRFLMNESGGNSSSIALTRTPPSQRARDTAGRSQWRNRATASDDVNNGNLYDITHGSSDSTNARSSNHTDPYSIRSAALLQHAIRRTPDFSSRHRDAMLRWVLDRDRSTAAAENASRTPAELSRQQSQSSGSRYEAYRFAQQASQRPNPYAWQDELHRRRQANDAARLSKKSSSDFEQMIKFLHTEVSALDTMERIERQVREKKKSVCIDSAMGRFRPAYCSWLTRGLVFSGFQQAAPTSTTTTTMTTTVGTFAQPSTYRSSSSQTLSPNHAPPNYPNRSFDPTEAWLMPGANNPQPRFSASPTPRGTTANVTASAGTVPAAAAHHDRWTVKVTIHDVDYDKMTLSGTMEAFNVPSLVSPRTEASATVSSTTLGSAPSNKTFCTYVEGELIDMANFTLQTESFHATPEIDATYWRKLEPFAKMTDSEIAVCLMDPDWIQKNLTEKYILMRWKEKCFVEGTLSSTAGVRPGAARPAQHDTSDHDEMDTSGLASLPNTAAPRTHASSEDTLPTPPTNHGHSASTFLSGADSNGFGLSISGFYYASLRRSDGWCEGLYYDPQSTPYQRLEMRPECGFGGWGMGSWSFR